MQNTECEHQKCWWYPLTKEWYFQIKEIECDDPDFRIYGIEYCPWCGMKLPEDGKLLRNK